MDVLLETARHRSASMRLSKQRRVEARLLRLKLRAPHRSADDDRADYEAKLRAVISAVHTHTNTHTDMNVSMSADALFKLASHTLSTHSNAEARRRGTLDREVRVLIREIETRLSRHAAHRHARLMCCDWPCVLRIRDALTPTNTALTVAVAIAARSMHMGTPFGTGMVWAASRSNERPCVSFTVRQSPP